MSTCVSAHGAAISTQCASFTVTIDKGWSVVRPTKADELKGSVFFPLHNLPQNASYLTAVDVYFSSQTARVDAVVVLSGSDKIFKKKGLRKTGDFTVDIHANSVKVGQDGKGLALLVEVVFENVRGRLDFQSAGLKVDVAPERAKLDGGTGNVMDVGSLNQPRVHGDHCVVGVVRVDDIDRALASDPKAFRRDLAELADDLTNRDLDFMDHRVPRYNRFLKHYSLRHPLHWVKSRENQTFDSYSLSSAKEGCGYREKDARERLRAYRAFTFIKSNAEGHATAYMAADTILRILDYVEHKG